MYKVIFHLNEPDKLETACRNIENLLNDMKESKEDIEVELLVQAKAVKLFIKEEASSNESIKDILDMEVKIAVCNNSLKGLKIEEKDLLEGTTVVTSGVGELTRKQHEGWAYIKP